MKTTRYRPPCILTLLLILCGLSVARAQGDRGTLLPGSPLGTMTTNYYFARSNELTITVDVIGYVQRPGRYEIASSVNAINLMALAGGATADGTLSDVLIARQVEEGGAITTREISLDLTRVSRLKPEDLALRPGDVIEVGRSGWTTFREIFTPIASAALIVAAVAQVRYFTK